MKSRVEGKKLFQKRGKNYRNFEISDTGLIVEYKQDKNYSKQEIEYDIIDLKEVLISREPNKFEVGLYFSIILNLFLLMYFIIDQIGFKEVPSSLIGGMSMGVIGGMSVWSVHIFKRDKLKLLKGQQTISFFYRDQEQEIVDEFIKKLKHEKNTYFRNKYLKIDEYIPLEIQKNNFLWMYQNEEITRIEYEELIEELNNLKIIKGE